MESLVNPSPAFWAGKVVLLTGHTGFKGAWLQLWLEKLGAQVHGFSLAPETSPNLSVLCGIADGANSSIGDVRDPVALDGIFQKIRPDVVLHLAAQALVRRSYVDPIESFSINLIGTLRVLEAASKCNSVRAAVMITTDKCYENREWIWPYRETEALGGHDPYSASKACAEIATAAWRSSLSDMPNFRREAMPLAIATARAGNVFGGGDWAQDRLIPDFFRAQARGEPLVIRNPQACRPWQHVLEPLAGYLLLAEHLWLEEAQAAYNFGPNQNDVQTVEYIVNLLGDADERSQGWVLAEGAQPHEAKSLALDASKARMELGWKPRLSLEEGLLWTCEWYRAVARGQDPLTLTQGQIQRYENLSTATLK